MTERPRVLISGFGPFPGVPQNVSSDVVVAAAHRISTRAQTADPQAAPEVIPLLLPTEWGIAADALAREFERSEPHAYIGFGVAKRIRGFVIETLARNEAKQVDAAAQAPASQRLCADAARYRVASWNARRLVRRLRGDGLPACRSLNAGSYLCNNVLFEAVARPGRAQRVLGAGFAHLPAGLADGDVGALSFVRAVDGAVAMIDEMLARPR
ncbi:MAG: hypothetical protein AAGJ53_10275 [Pseudomonadota bacterium]